MGMFGGKAPKLPGTNGSKGDLSVEPYTPPNGKLSTDAMMKGLRELNPPITIDKDGQVVEPKPDILEWGERVNRLRDLRNGEDNKRWDIGEEIAAMCIELGFDPRPGRPAANADVRTLSELAQEVDISSKRLSENWKNYDFYRDRRMTGDYATWAHHDLARRNSDGDLDQALYCLAIAKKQHLHYRAFQRWFEGILFEGELTRDELVNTWDSFVQPGQRVFVTFTLIDE